MSRRIAHLALLAACLLGTAVALLGAPPASATTPVQRTTLLDVEDGLMCVACHVPLALANSPEAQAERQYVEQLIAKGYTKQQILRAMVAQYGTAVLAKPPARGVSLLIYVLPPAAVAAGALLVALALPRWRRRARQAAAAPIASGTPLSAEDARRLEQDLARFD
jgi:cytochrome c-type biogenesis protein CcmH